MKPLAVSFFSGIRGGMQGVLARFRGWVFGLFILASLAQPAGVALGVERFPPPEFEPGYKMPATTAPAPRAELLEYVDVAVLLAALTLSSYWVIKKRSRKAILGLATFSLLYFGFYRKGCVCAIGSVQDVVLALADPGYAVPIGVLGFFLLPLLFTLFFGRTFCAAVCPHGALQDLVLLRPLKIRPWLEHALGLVPYVYLGAAILFAATGSAFIICEYDPFVGFFRRSGSFGMLAFGGALLLAGVFIGRPYCRFLCPYGALLSLISRISKWNVTLTPNDCIQCQLCDVACPYGAIAEPAEYLPSPRASAAWPKWIGLALLAVLLIGGSGWLGNRLAVAMSQVHPTVRLAERIAAEEAGKIVEVAETAVPATAVASTIPDTPEETMRLASKAFRQSGRPIPELLEEALRIRHRFVLDGWIFGAFVGLVLGAKLISLAIPQPRNIYEPNRANCVACGRCYSYCPKELARVKKLQRKEVCPAEARANGA
jgi:NosR/NirI family nitrous oxide reductase transcriptional regulator